MTRRSRVRLAVVAVTVVPAPASPLPAQESGRSLPESARRQALASGAREAGTALELAEGLAIVSGERPNDCRVAWQPVSWKGFDAKERGPIRPG
ncbi:MAG: hypothetical protein ACRD21_18725 [Vicinamibacteria bacterium]